MHFAMGRDTGTVWASANFLAQGRQQTAMDMYLAITSDGAQVAALKAATRHLPAKFREIFDAIWNLGAPLAAERHPLAHWMMGYSKELRSGLVFLNPRDGLKQLAHNVSS